MYNNPFMYQSFAKPGLLSRLFGGAGALRGATSGINWGTLLSNTQKSLGIINQAIPLVYQVKPIISNAKTMFKIADALKGDKKNSTSNNNSRNNTNNSINNSNKKVENKKDTGSSNSNKPIFYI